MCKNGLQQKTTSLLQPIFIYIGYLTTTTFVPLNCGIVQPIEALI